LIHLGICRIAHVLLYQGGPYIADALNFVSDKKTSPENAMGLLP